MATEMLERVAKAIHYEACGKGYGRLNICSWPPADPKRRAATYAIAAAAISAMGEPTEEMVQAGEAVETEGSTGYRTMIRAALEGWP